MNRRSECRLFARKLIFIYLLLRPQTVWKFDAVKGTLLVTAGPLAQKEGLCIPYCSFTFMTIKTWSLTSYASPKGTGAWAQGP